MPDIGLILLAAGGSSRMGRPKQLLPFQGRTMLRHMAEAALASVCRPVVVVLGSNADSMQSELAGLPVQIAINPDWESGMGSSIRTGVLALQESGVELDAAVIMLCDQPMVTSDTLDALVGTFRVGEEVIVASEYGDDVGVPALFARTLFDDLAALPLHEGAKSFILAHREQASRVIFPGGAVDLDLPEEYNALQATLADLPNQIEPSPTTGAAEELHSAE